MINDQLSTAVVFIPKSTINNQHGVMPCRTMLDMIAKDLLVILVCPACKQGLEYRQNPESLKCTACHRVYAVKDDIPIMLVDQATVETS